MERLGPSPGLEKAGKFFPACCHVRKVCDDSAGAEVEMSSGGFATGFLVRSSTHGIGDDRMRWPKTRKARILLVVIVGAIAIPPGMVVRREWHRRELVRARQREALVRTQIDAELVDNVRIRPPRDGLTGMLFHLGIQRPYYRRAEAVFVRVSPIDREGRATRSLGQTIDLCRSISDAIPAEIVLRPRLPIADAVAAFGPPSSRSRANLGMIKDIEYLTYGNLDVGIKDGVLVAVRVR
jgi:hypothetical protein